MQNIVRHFVDDAGSSLAQPLKFRDIIVRQPARQTRVHLVQRAPLSMRKHGIAEAGEIAELPRARNARVARGDLLDQARARTRHADNEHRRFRRISVRFDGRIKRGVERLDQTRDLALQRCVIVNLPETREPFAVRCVALGETRKRLIVSAGVVEHRPERKTEPHAMLDLDLRRGRQRPQPVHMRFIARQLTDHRQAAMSVGQIRIQRQGALETRPRLVEAANHPHCRAKPRPSSRRIGREINRLSPSCFAGV